MSYDLWVTENGEELYLKNDSPTYNYGKMIREADRLAGGEGCSFAAIDRVYGVKAEIWFRRILFVLRRYKRRMKELAPSNGWGTYEGLVTAFTGYQALAKKHPGSHWHQSGDGGAYKRCCGGWYCGQGDAGTELKTIVDEFPGEGPDPGRHVDG